MSLSVYALDAQGEPVVTTTADADWGWKNPLRQVARTEIGGCYVSTVFLVLDHNHSKTGDPILWETMLFGDAAGELDHWQDRCGGFRANAVRMHEEAVAMLKGALGLLKIAPPIRPKLASLGPRKLIIT